MRLLITPLFVIAVAFPASDATAGSMGAATNAEDTSAEMARVTAAPLELQWIDTLMSYHEITVAVVRMSRPMVQRPELKEAAQQFMDDHLQDLAQLREWRHQWYPRAPVAETRQSQPASRINLDFAEIQTLRGKALELAFLAIAIRHCETGLAIGREVSISAEQAPLRTLVANMMERQEKAIEQMQQWTAEWRQ